MNIKDITNNGLCLGCGICTFDKSITSMKYSKSKGMNIPLIDPKKQYTIANSICPAIGYPICEDGKNLYNNGKYSVELGFVDKLFAAHSLNQNILKNASSGGVISEILIFLLKNKIVDKVGVTKFTYSPDGPQTSTFLTSDIDEILSCQGSKYCPVDISNCITEIKQNNYKIAYIGTPCQVAGIRQIQKIDKDIKNKIVLTIANFCGGIKSSNQIKKISTRHNINFKDIVFFRFRGGGQPGSMVIKDRQGNYFEASYKKYGGFTGYSKLLRCHLCVDATGELADIACGDAWLDNYLKDSSPWSVILTRSKEGSSIIESMAKKNIITLEPLSEEKVCLSQSQNIKSKKLRQFTRFKLYKLFGYSTPHFDGGYYKNPTSMKTELIVFSTHMLKELIEKAGLYKYFRFIIGKPY